MNVLFFVEEEDVGLIIIEGIKGNQQ